MENTNKGKSHRLCIINMTSIIGKDSRIAFITTYNFLCYCQLNSFVIMEYIVLYQAQTQHRNNEYLWEISHKYFLSMKLMLMFPKLYNHLLDSYILYFNNCRLQSWSHFFTSTKLKVISMMSSWCCLKSKVQSVNLELLFLLLV